MAESLRVPSSDSHGKPVPKEENGVVHSGISQDGMGNVLTLGNPLLDITVTPAPCTACGYLNCPQDKIQEVFSGGHR